MSTPTEILDAAFHRASININEPVIKNPNIVNNIEYVCRFLGNRACVRLLLACSLAKVHKPEVDIRKPYTEIGDSDIYSGRRYDESYISPFISKHNLPCNPTTAFLTPALRNRNTTLTPDLNLVGNYPKLYQSALQLLSDVHEEAISADDLLTETIRWLLIIRDEKLLRMETLLAGLKSSGGTINLSAEAIVGLIRQHLNCKGSSRLPVLIVTAAYQAASAHLGERVLPLEAHNAADEQTGSLGDVQVTLIGDDNIVTAYEMKTRRVTQIDIDRALQKLNHKIDNYIFITTEDISEQVHDYAATMYERTGGIEVVILDCIGFLRHFLHLFHRLRMLFLEAYQKLVLEEPESAVSQPLKEAFLALRQAAETDNEAS